MSATAELLTTQVDLKGLMKVLGQNLYSTPSVALRELVQNAHDSCTRRRLESDDTFESRVLVIPDPVRGTLSIEDTGAGLTRDEIERYLATVGAGYTGRMRDSGDGEGLIGYFGLGFLSAYFVSDRVELITTSYQSPDVGWAFSSRGGERYQLRSVAPRSVGTRVTLHLADGFKSLASVAGCAVLLRKYCCLLEHPVHLESTAVLAINRPLPPWRQAETNPIRQQREALAFASRFEGAFEPLCTLPLVDGPAEGLLWIQDGGTYGSSDNRNMSVFIRGMLVSDDARELLPRWAGFCGGVIEANGLTPTASREDIQRDEIYEAVEAQIAESLVEGLAALGRNNPAAWRRVLQRHNEALLGAALCDDRLFELVAESLRLPTTEGQLTAKAILGRSKGRIHISLGDGGGYEEVLFRATQVPVVIGTRYGALPFAERYCALRGGTTTRLGTKAANAALFAPHEVSAQVQQRLDSLFGAPGQAVVATRFAPQTLPVVLVPDRDVALKERLEGDAADKRISSAVLGLARMFTEQIDDTVRARLFVNLDAPVVRGLLEADPDAPATRHVAAVTRSFADLMTDRQEGLLDVDAVATFGTLSGALTGLLSPQPS